MLSKKNFRDYWNHRAKWHGAASVGFMNKGSRFQLQEYEEKISFVKPHLRNLGVTIDWGCGVGLWAHLFKPEEYIGVDITESLVEIAREKNPKHTFLYWAPQQKTKLPHFDTLFTSTVLQHNDDVNVRDVFKIVRKRNKAPKIVLYENTTNAKNSAHMAFRTPEEYHKLVSEFFNVKKFEHDTHIIHGENHSVMCFETYLP